MADVMEKGIGYILVQVSSADRAIPIPDANVVISGPTDRGEDLIRVMKTDRSGKTEVLSVPAPPAENSLTPDGGVRFFKYNIRVDYPGYYTTENVNVPVFEGQKSIQQVSLIPLKESSERGKVVTVNEEEPFEEE